jgi:phenylacetate-CoA ligase
VHAEGELRARLLEGVSAPTWEPRLHRLIETGPSFAMDVHQDPRRQLEWLYRITPDYLVSYPSNLEFLAGLIEESGRPLPGLKIIKSLSESLSAETLARVEAAFGAPVKNTYSCMEAGYLASPCPEGHGLHVHAENVLLEVLDDAGEPCPPGKAGRVVLTALHNFRMPLVRYEIMDEAAFSLERCPCGRGLPLLDPPIGKRHPLFRLPDGRSKNTIGLAVAMRKIGGTHQYRVVQRAIDRVLVRVVPNRNFNAEHEQRIRNAMRNFFESAVHVTVETTERLELTVSGKSPHLVSELENESGSRAPT